jgi:hypothetical protein
VNHFCLFVVNNRRGGRVVKATDLALYITSMSSLMEFSFLIPLAH